MSIKEDTNVIDEKKKEEYGFAPDFKAFAHSYIFSIVFTIGISIFIIGGLGLYSTKVAQANILPDDIDLAPYTIYDRIVREDIPIDINIMRPSFWSENKDTVCQKIIFDSQEYLDRFSDTFLCYFKKKSNIDSGLFSNGFLFLSNSYENILAKNYFLINKFFFYLSYLPESIIMLLYGFFGIFFWSILYLLTLAISLCYHLISIPTLFRDDPKNTSYIYYIKKTCLAFFWMFIGLISAFLCPIFFTLYGLISPLTASYKIQNTNKLHGVYDFIKDIFAYKKFFFFVLATISLFSNGYKNLGFISIPGIIIAVVFSYIMGLYINEMPKSGDDGFTFSIKENTIQAVIEKLDKSKIVKICEKIPIDIELKNNIGSAKFREVTKRNSIRGNSIGGNSIERNSIGENSIGENSITTPLLQTPINQLGGKKIKKNLPHFTKKYNIRLV